MFLLAGLTSIVGWCVSARPAVDALSAIVNINDLPSLVPIPYEPEHAPTLHILLVAWAALVIQSFVFSAAAWWKLRKV
jgi:hypothetical protein